MDMNACKYAPGLAKCRCVILLRNVLPFSDQIRRGITSRLSLMQRQNNIVGPGWITVNLLSNRLEYNGYDQRYVLCPMITFSDTNQELCGVINFYSYTMEYGRWRQWNLTWLLTCDNQTKTENYHVNILQKDKIMIVWKTRVCSKQT